MDSDEVSSLAEETGKFFYSDANTLTLNLLPGLALAMVTLLCEYFYKYISYIQYCMQTQKKIN